MPTTVRRTSQGVQVSFGAGATYVLSESDAVALSNKLVAVLDRGTS